MKATLIGELDADPPDAEGPGLQDENVGDERKKKKLFLAFDGGQLGDLSSALA